MCVYIDKMPGDCLDCAELPSSESPSISKKLPATMMTGGLSDTKPATPEVQHIVNQVKPQFESRVNGTCDIFQAIVYRTQVVAGINYFIKVQVSNTDYVHLRVFQSLPHENQGPSLVSFETGKTRDDPLTYF
ncbi:cystatin-A-like [Athene cunicularia]|uniref:Cystatin-A-like n=1 Tax=Athene cunicularia TaxID=194338 RepID=A0A663LTJ8_ATHCN|nr:cystatin-A-like [Athene cunicularia]XP_026716938.1 cystatin-A-like [Athene cunicularia]XP_026716947.1 cystatin-A-like [Athene cunicularia]